MIWTAPPNRFRRPPVTQEFTTTACRSYAVAYGRGLATARPDQQIPLDCLLRAAAEGEEAFLLKLGDNPSYAVLKFPIYDKQGNPLTYQKGIPMLRPLTEAGSLLWA